MFKPKFVAVSFIFWTVTTVLTAKEIFMIIFLIRISYVTEQFRGHRVKYSGCLCACFSSSFISTTYAVFIAAAHYLMRITTFPWVYHFLAYQRF
jgi:hypothetical protein